MNLVQVTQTLRIREYYYMMLRHKLSFLIVTGLALFVSLILAFTLPKIYRADTVLLVQDEDILNPLISGLAIAPSFSQRIRTLREELLSWQRLTLLVEKLGMDKGIRGPVQYERLIKNLRDHIVVRLQDARIVSVGFEGTDPQEAQNIVQTLADIVIDGTLTSQSVEASSAINFIQGQLDEYRTKLEKSEVELRKFRELYSSTLPVATHLNEQLVALKMELNQLLVANTEEHPRVKQTRQLIETMEKQRDAQMSQAQKEGVEIDPAEYAKLVSSVPLQEQQLTKLQRDYAVNDRIYESLLQRLETAKISETLEESDKGPKFRILEPARLPLEPVKPKKGLILLAGLAVGFALGFVLVYLLELSNTSIRNLDEARDVLTLPIFGSIPPINPEELLIEENLRRQA